MASRASKTGGYDCKFVDPPPDKLECQICLLVVRTPHQMICCGRVYCKVCLDEHKKHSNTCPNCRKRGQNFSDTRGEWTSGSSHIMKWILNFLHVVDQEVKQLLVKCSNSEKGCNWSGQLQSLNYHLKECGFTLLRCPNECTEEEKILRRDLDNHLIVCPNRQCECPHCKATGRYCDITTTHLGTCLEVKVICINLECEAKMLRRNLSDHLKTCEFTLIHCPNKCMKHEKELTISRRDLDQHLRKCPNRQYECPHCKDTGKYCDITTTTHLDTCPKVEIPCPNSECMH